MIAYPIETVLHRLLLPLNTRIVSAAWNPLMRQLELDIEAEDVVEKAPYSRRGGL